MLVVLYIYRETLIRMRSIAFTMEDIDGKDVRGMDCLPQTCALGHFGCLIDAEESLESPRTELENFCLRCRLI